MKLSSSDTWTISWFLCFRLLIISSHENYICWRLCEFNQSVKPTLMVNSIFCWLIPFFDSKASSPSRLRWLSVLINHEDVWIAKLDSTTKKGQSSSVNSGFQIWITHLYLQNPVLVPAFPDLGLWKCGNYHQICWCFIMFTLKIAMLDYISVAFLDNPISGLANPTRPAPFHWVTEPGKGGVKIENSFTRSPPNNKLRKREFNLVN